MDPRQALSAFRDEKVRGHDLLRILTMHDGWRMLAVRQDDGVRPLLRVVDEDRWIQVFTDDDAFQEHLKRGDEQSHEHDWVEVSGRWLFENLTDDLAGLDVNPLLDDAIHYKREQFPVLRDWAQSIRIETILAEQDTSPEAAGRIAAAKFYLAFVEGESGPQLALAPDRDQKRTFAAIFTAPDALIFYTSQAEQVLKTTLKTNVMVGQTLFRNLSEMPLDGLVFNCLGPTAPVAVTLDFARAFA